MLDNIIDKHERGLAISGIRTPYGEDLRVGVDGIGYIIPVPIAGSGGWMYWLEVERNGDISLFNPLQLLSIEYRSQDE